MPNWYRGLPGFNERAPGQMSPIIPLSNPTTTPARTTQGSNLSGGSNVSSGGLPPLSYDDVMAGRASQDEMLNFVNRDNSHFWNPSFIQNYQQTGTRTPIKAPTQNTGAGNNLSFQGFLNWLQGGGGSGGATGTGGTTSPTTPTTPAWGGNGMPTWGILAGGGLDPSPTGSKDTPTTSPAQTVSAWDPTRFANPIIQRDTELGLPHSNLVMEDDLGNVDQNWVNNYLQQHPLPVSSSGSPAVSAPGVGKMSTTAKDSTYNTTPQPHAGQGWAGLVPGNIDLPNPAGDLAQQIPGLANLNASIANNLQSWSEGQLSPSTIRMLQDSNAAWGARSGMPNSQFINNRLARNLGLTSEQLQQQAIQGYNQFIPTVSGTQTVSPTLQTEVAGQNALNLAAPDPTAAQSHAEQLFRQYMDAMRGPNSGTQGRTMGPQGGTTGGQATVGGTPIYPNTPGRTGTGSAGPVWTQYPGGTTVGWLGGNDFTDMFGDPYSYEDPYSSGYNAQDLYDYYGLTPEDLNYFYGGDTSGLYDTGGYSDYSGYNDYSGYEGYDTAYDGYGWDPNYFGDY